VTVKAAGGQLDRALDDLVHLQDLGLLLQARGIDLDSRDQRVRSRNRLQDFFQRLQQILRPEITLEIGAHKAQFSQRMARMGFEAHAFEANPYNHAVFSPFLKRRAPEVSYHHLAVSDADGEVSFQVKQSRDGKAVSKVAGNNSLLERTDASFAYDTVTVPATRLDNFLTRSDLGGRSFSAWIDVEGALGKVTDGFGSALQSCLSLIVEVEETSYWQGQMLVFDAMRYFAGQGLVPVARDFEAPHQYNLVYLRKDMLQVPEVRLALTRYLQGN
jgi:FkbM family methyltransferase